MASKKRGGLSEREYKAANLPKPVSVKPFVSKTLQSKTPTAKLIQAQKSQPVYGPPKPKDLNYTPKINYTPGLNYSPKPKVTGEEKVLNLKRDEEKKESERTKSPVKTALKNAYNTAKGLLTEKNVQTFAAPSTTKFSVEDIRKSNATAKEAVKGTVKGIGSVGASILRTAQLPGKAVGYLNRKLGLDTAEEVRKRKEAAQDVALGKIEEKSTASTPGEAKFSGAFEVASNFLPGGVAGKTGALSKGLGRVVRKAGEAGVSPTGINQLIQKGDAFESIGKSITQNATFRAGKTLGPKTAQAAEYTPVNKISSSIDDLQPSLARQADVPNTPETVPQSPVVRPGATIAEGGDQLPKKNPNRPKEVFAEADATGREKVYVNVRNGQGGLDKVEIGEFDEAGQFKASKAEDGRDASVVAEESQKNIESGKRGLTRLDSPGDSRAVIRRGFGTGAGRKVGVLGRGRASANAKQKISERLKDVDDPEEAGFLMRMQEKKNLTDEELNRVFSILDKPVLKGAKRLGDVETERHYLGLAKKYTFDEFEQAFPKGTDRQTIRELYMEGRKTKATTLAAHGAGTAVGIEEDEQGNLSYNIEKGLLGGLGTGLGAGFLTRRKMNAVMQGRESLISGGKATQVARESKGSLDVKPRGFIQNVKKSGVSQEVKEMAEGSYVPRNSAELVQNAKNLVRDFPDQAERIVRSTKDTDVTRAVAMELIKKHSDAGNHTAAIDLIERLAPKATEAGRATQILAYFGRLTPEGVGRFAQRQLDIANEMFPNANLKLSEKQYADFYEKAKELQKLPDGYDKDFKTAILLRDIKDQFPSSVAAKLGTFQTIGQLLNPKTFVRNFGGNVLFGMGLENITQAVARTPVDALVGLFTGKRTTGLPGLLTQARSFKKGLLQGGKEAMEGISIGPNTQFDLPQTRVFRGKIMGNLEKAMGMSLRGPDKAAYTAAYDDSIRAQMKANKSQVATPEMLETAHYDGLYRTFQDDNLVSRFFSSGKKWLNNIGIPGADGERFGLGDLILKYPKTPGSLIARGIDYSPAGFIKTVFEIGKPLFGKPFNQKGFVDSFSRALTGSAGLVGTGAMLSELGIITGSPEKDIDVRATKRTQGETQYQINVSGLKRYILSGFNKDAAKKREGDTLVSYDWAQPMAAPVSLGVKLAEGDASGAGGAIAESITGGVDTLQEQSLVTGLKRLFGYGDIKGGLEETAKGTLASFVPTLSNQVRQFTDNTRRSTYDPNLGKETLNRAISKVPGAASTLPASSDVLGNESENYQEGSNNFFNVFLNPSFVSKMKESPEAKMVLELFEKTGEVSQMPRVTPKKVGDRTLTAQEYVDFQKFTGEKTKEAFSLLAGSEAFRNLGDYEKVKRLSSILTDVGKLAKADVLGDGVEAKSIDEIKQKVSAQDKYSQIQSLYKEGKDTEADAILDNMSEEELENFQKVSTVEKTKKTNEGKEKLKPTVDKIKSLYAEGNDAEADAIVDSLSDDELHYLELLLK